MAQQRVEACLRRVQLAPLDAGAWDALAGAVVALPETRRTASSLGLALLRAAREGDEPLLVCVVGAWNAARKVLLFRPKLETLRDMVLARLPHALTPGSAKFLEVVLEEFHKDVLAATTPRTPFELVCTNHAVFVGLLRLAFPDKRDAIVTIATTARAILAQCIFSVDNLTNTCTSPRAGTATITNTSAPPPPPAKETNQRDWRIAFWTAVDAALGQGLFPRGSLEFLCQEAKRRDSEHISLFWFELLFKSVSNGSGSAQLESCLELLRVGSAWYSPTSEDVPSLEQWYRVARGTFGPLCVDVLRSTRDVDYRAVEPFFQAHLVDVMMMKSEEDATPAASPLPPREQLALTILETYVKTRRLPDFMHLVVACRKLAGKERTWFLDLGAQLQFRDRVIATLASGVLEHQYALIWQFFFDHHPAVLHDELLLCVFESFVWSILATPVPTTTTTTAFSSFPPPTASSRLLAMDIAQLAECARSTFAHVWPFVESPSKFRVGRDMVSTHVSVLGLIRVCMLLLRVCGNASAVGETANAGVFREIAEKRGDLTDADARAMKRLLALTALWCSVQNAPGPTHETTEWIFTALLETGGFGESPHLLLSPKLALEDSERNLTAWRLVFGEHASDHSLACLLEDARFYEHIELRDGFEGFVAGLPPGPDRNRVLRVAASAFPTGYLTKSVMKKILIATIPGKEDAGDHMRSWCAFLQSACRLAPKLILKVLPPDADSILEFLERALQCCGSHVAVRVATLYTTVVKRKRVFAWLAGLRGKLLLDSRNHAKEEWQDILGTVLTTFAERISPTKAAADGTFTLDDAAVSRAMAQALVQLCTEPPTSARNGAMRLSLGSGMIRLGRAVGGFSSSQSRKRQRHEGADEHEHLDVDCPFPVGSCLQHAVEELVGGESTDATRRGPLRDALAFLGAVCEVYDDEDDTVIFPLLASSALFANSRFAFAYALERLMVRSSTRNVGGIVDALVRDSWSCDCEARAVCARGFETVMRIGARKAFEHVLERRWRAVFAALANLVQKDDSDAAWNALVAFLTASPSSSSSLNNVLTGRDVVVFLGASARCRNPLKVRFLHALSEFHASCVSSGSVSGAFAQEISLAERQIFFCETPHSSNSKGNEEEEEEANRRRLATANELVRLCKSLKPMEKVFRHHVVSVLCDHVTLLYVRGVALESLRRPMELVAFHLLDLCGEHELQQLHAALGGGMGGARRELFRRIVNEHQKKHVYRGA